jgi:hypothetical protein
LETESDEMPDGKEQPDTGAEERNEAGVPGPRRVFATLKTLGPGLVAGASDIDPTTVATMAVVGAEFVNSELAPRRTLAPGHARCPPPTKHLRISCSLAWSEVTPVWAPRSVILVLLC